MIRRHWYNYVQFITILELGSSPPIKSIRGYSTGLSNFRSSEITLWRVSNSLGRRLMRGVTKTPTQWCVFRVQGICSSHACNWIMEVSDLFNSDGNDIYEIPCHRPESNCHYVRVSCIVLPLLSNYRYYRIIIRWLPLQWVWQMSNIVYKSIFTLWNIVKTSNRGPSEFGKRGVNPRAIWAKGSKSWRGDRSSMIDRFAIIDSSRWYNSNSPTIATSRTTIKDFHAFSSSEVKNSFITHLCYLVITRKVHNASMVTECPSCGDHPTFTLTKQRWKLSVCNTWLHTGVQLCQQFNHSFLVGRSRPCLDVFEWRWLSSIQEEEGLQIHTKHSKWSLEWSGWTCAQR